MLQGIVVSVNSSSAPYKSREENLETFKHQRFLFTNHTPTDSTIQSVLNSAKHIKQYNIAKTPRDRIELAIGGVVGDTHFHPPRQIEKDGERFVERRIAEVNFFKIERYTELNNLFGTAVGAGAVGENITTSGIDLDNLPKDTILHIGSAKVKILSRRSFCYKFINTFVPNKDFWPLADREKFDRAKVGIVGQIFEPGIVRAGDPIIAELPDHCEPMPVPIIPEKFITTKIVD
jgi:hypothetical protein